MIFKRITLSVTLLLCLSSAAFADPFKNGYLAFNEGNYDQAIAIWIEGAEQGYYETMEALVNLYENGAEGWDDIPDYPPNPTLAAKWRQKLEVQNTKEIRTDRIYKRGITAYDANDYGAAFPDLLEASHGGNAWAQSKLAIMYYFGQGTEVDYKQAAHWAETAANRGHRYARSQIGTLYYLGHGVPRSNSKAIKWFNSAVESGETSSMIQLGVMYETGDAVSQDFEKAASLYKLAEAGGNPDGTIYYNKLKAASDKWHREQKRIEEHNRRVRKRNAQIRAANARRAAEQASTYRQPYQYKSWTTNYATPATPFGSSASAKRNWNRYNCALSQGRTGC